MYRPLYGIVLGLASLAGLLFAQWPDYPKGGEPRTTAGHVDLSGPAPRAADGHPDLSGVWDRGIPPDVPPGPPRAFGQPGVLVPFSKPFTDVPRGLAHAALGS